MKDLHKYQKHRNENIIIYTNYFILLFTKLNLLMK